MGLVQMMRSEGLAPTEITYNILLRLCGLGGCWAMGLELMGMMEVSFFSFSFFRDNIFWYIYIYICIGISQKYVSGCFFLPPYALLRGLVLTTSGLCLLWFSFGVSCVFGLSLGGRNLAPKSSPGSHGLCMYNSRRNCLVVWRAEAGDPLAVQNGVTCSLLSCLVLS